MVRVARPIINQKLRVSVWSGLLPSPAWLLLVLLVEALAALALAVLVLVDLGLADAAGLDPTLAAEALAGTSVATLLAPGVGVLVQSQPPAK